MFLNYNMNNINNINNFNNNNNIYNINSINNIYNNYNMNNTNSFNNNNNIHNITNINNINNYNNINNTIKNEDNNYNTIKNEDNNWTIIFSKKPENDYFDSYPFINIYIQTKPYETVKVLINRYKTKANDNKDYKKFIYNDKELFPDEKILESVGLKNNSTIKVLYIHLKQRIKEIKIQFIKSSPNLYQINFFPDISGFLKLYILKEISQKINNNYLQKLLNNKNYYDIGSIMNTLKNGYYKINHQIQLYKNIEFEFMIENLDYFSNYVDKTIDSNCIINFLENLKGKELMEVCDSIYRLEKYKEFMKFLEFEIEKSKKESIFEFSINSFMIIERKNYEAFLKEREKCPNKKVQILFCGVGFVPNSNNLDNILNKRKLTDSFEYSWLQYINSQTINKEKDKIPGLNESINLITYYTYYNEYCIKYGNNNNHLEKNEINITYKNTMMETVIHPTKTNFLERNIILGILIRYAL